MTTTKYSHSSTKDEYVTNVEYFIWFMYIKTGELQNKTYYYKANIENTKSKTKYLNKLYLNNAFSTWISKY